MNNVERIYYMLQENDCNHWFRDNADTLRLAGYLDKKGCIAPPCKVGDKVYAVDKRSGLWWQGKIISMYYANKNDIQFAVAFDDGEVAIYDWDSVFLTKEEAEKALRKDEGK